jgi:hypothetical protein
MHNADWPLVISHWTLAIAYLLRFPRPGIAPICNDQWPICLSYLALRNDHAAIAGLVNLDFPAGLGALSGLSGLARGLLEPGVISGIYLPPARRLK